MVKVVKKKKRWEDMTPQEQAAEMAKMPKPFAEAKPEPEPEPEPKEPEPAVSGAPKTPQPIYSEKGKIRGVIMPDGREIIGISEEEALGLIQAQMPTPVPAGTVPTYATAFEKGKQEEIEIAMEGRTQKAMEVFQKYQGKSLPQDVLDAMTPAEIDWYQAIATGGFQAGVGAAGGAALGLLGGGVPSIPLAIAGGIGGAVTGIRSNIASQLGGEISASQVPLEKGEMLMRQVINNINQGGDPALGVQYFYELRDSIYYSHAQLKLDTQQDLAKFTGKDGTPQLARYETFFAHSLSFYERRLLQAIENPNPTKILSESGLNVMEEENV